MDKLCLHLGCSDTKIPGFVNIDIVETPATDWVCDIRFLSHVEDNSVDLIYACNVLEHIGKTEFYSVLKRWCAVLKPEGILRLSVPNLEAVFKYYVETGDMEGIYSSVYGGQKTEYDCHRWGWDFKTLKKDLTKCGYRDVRYYDRDKTEHAHIRDWSENYLPQLMNDRITIYYTEWKKGTNIALNVEATK